MECIRRDDAPSVRMSPFGPRGSGGTRVRRCNVDRPGPIEATEPPTPTRCRFKRYGVSGAVHAARRRYMEGLLSRMRLPQGKHCSDCVQFRKCSWLICREGNEELCDWDPSKFVDDACPPTEPNGGKHVPAA